MEPTALTQMCKYLDTIYVSGWQSSSTASSTDEPSPDLADYPMVGSVQFVIMHADYARTLYQIRYSSSLWHNFSMIASSAKNV